jgi:Poly(ADP-ribose) polymerase catalytic domain
VICTDIHDGFMMQRSRPGSWGQGIYFAANASYSNRYAFSDRESSLKTLILVRLAVGEEIHLPASSSLRHCPDKPNGTGRYDTVTGTSIGSKLFIVYENGRGYLITLTTLLRSSFNHYRLCCNSHLHNYWTANNHRGLLSSSIIWISQHCHLIVKPLLLPRTNTIIVLSSSQ